MEVYKAVLTRRSVRRFKDKAVPFEALEKCVNAGRLAPSAWNVQPLEYVAIDDAEFMPRVNDTITGWAGQKRKPGSPFPGNAPKAGIVILINRKTEAELNGNNKYSTYDTALAAENMMLVALEQGLGSCPILAYDESLLKKVLNVPDNYDIALLILLGYPAESPVTEVFAGETTRWIDEQGVRHVPKRRLEDIMHRNGM